MKFNLSFNAIIIGILLLLFVIFFRRGKQNFTSGQRKQEISQTAAFTEKDTREIRITTKQFSFSPDIIRLKLNEKVRFRIRSEDVAHGFSLPELGIDEVILPGKETIIDFQATKRGKFTLLCSVQCGAGHSGMRGTIIVE